MIPKDHLLRRINVFVTSVLGDLHERLEPFYSDVGHPSIDPELLIRMLIVCYCYGIRSERKLCQEVRLHLAYRWFCRLDLDDAVPHRSTFSENRLNRFRERDIPIGRQSESGQGNWGDNPRDLPSRARRQDYRVAIGGAAALPMAARAQLRERVRRVSILGRHSRINRELGPLK